MELTDKGERRRMKKITVRIQGYFPIVLDVSLSDDLYFS